MYEKINRCTLIGRPILGDTQTHTQSKRWIGSHHISWGQSPFRWNCSSRRACGTLDQFTIESQKRDREWERERERGAIPWRVYGTTVSLDWETVSVRCIVANGSMPHVEGCLVHLSTHCHRFRFTSGTIWLSVVCTSVLVLTRCPSLSSRYLGFALLCA